MLVTVRAQTDEVILEIPSPSIKEAQAFIRLYLMHGPGEIKYIDGVFYLNFTGVFDKGPLTQGKVVQYRIAPDGDFTRARIAQIPYADQERNWDFSEININRGQSSLGSSSRFVTPPVVAPAPRKYTSPFNFSLESFNSSLPVYSPSPNNPEPSLYASSFRAPLGRSQSPIRSPPRSQSLVRSQSPIRSSSSYQSFSSQSPIRSSSSYQSFGSQSPIRSPPRSQSLGRSQSPIRSPPRSQSPSLFRSQSPIRGPLLRQVPSSPSLRRPSIADYAILSQEREQFPTSVGARGENVGKNRWRDVLPHDHSRVVLDDGRYINADLIPWQEPSDNIIATQCPTPQTEEDFWEMVYEKGSVVYMVTPLDQAKTHKYWPDDKEEHQYGKVSVLNKQCRVERETLLQCVFRLRKNIGGWDIDRNINFFKVEVWEDRQAISVETAMLYVGFFFANAMRNRNGQPGKSPIIHCSAGIGRTGTMIAIINAVRWIVRRGGLAEGEYYPLADAVRHLRQYRAGAVQTPIQYQLIIDFLDYFTHGYREDEKFRKTWNAYVLS